MSAVASPFVCFFALNHHFQRPAPRFSHEQTCQIGGPSLLRFLPFNQVMNLTLHNGTEPGNLFIELFPIETCRQDFFKRGFSV